MADKAKHVADRDTNKRVKRSLTVGNVTITFAKDGGEHQINLASLEDGQIHHLLMRGAQIVLRNAIINQRKKAAGKLDGEGTAKVVPIPDGPANARTKRELDRVWHAWQNGELGSGKSSRSGLDSITRDVFLQLLADNGVKTTDLKAKDIKARWESTTDEVRTWVNDQAAKERAAREARKANRPTIALPGAPTKDGENDAK